MNLAHTNTACKKVSEIEIPDIYYNRLDTGDSALNAIFGNGGLMPGSVIAINAAPGTGKSRFCLQLAETLVNRGYSAEYLSGEEDAPQIAYNCKVLDIVNIPVGVITDVEEICEHMEHLDFLVVDSFQSLTTKENLPPRRKITYAVNKLTAKAKNSECTLVFIVHSTTQNRMKGGTELPHAVDVTISIDKDEEMGYDYRRITNSKNRFGPTGQYGARMAEKGYQFMTESESESEIRELEATKEVVLSRKELKTQRIASILSWTEFPYITIDRLEKEFELTTVSACVILRELEKSGKILKFGRGDTSIWRPASVDFVTFCSNTLKQLKL